MPAILIDYDNIVSSKLKQKFPKPPNTKRGFLVGLVIITDEEQIRNLSNIPQGKQRVEYLNTSKFIDSIGFYTFIMYNLKKEICLLNPDITKYTQDILSALFSGLSNTTTLWVSVDIQDSDCMSSIQKLASNGFNSPYITNMSPLRVGIPVSVALVRQNTPTEQYNVSATLNKVKHAIEEHKKSDTSCSLYAQFSSKAVSFLQKASKMGITLNKNGEKSQKELTGELSVGNVKKEGNKFIYVIDVDEGSVESGEEEDVDVSASRYNFHSHPHEAYVRHRVDKAWPSLTDYLGYLQLGINTIFHCVATLEGVYIMSFSPYWGKRLKKIDKNFIKDNYNIDHKEKYTPKEYAEKVNSIKYKSYPIYNVEYIPWVNAKKVFQVSYAKIGLSCITTEKGRKSYKKLYNN